MDSFNSKLVEGAYMNLSPHFTLAEMTRTDVRWLVNAPEAAEVERLRTLCEQVLEPLREEFGPLRIHSGFRSRELNSVIGGSATSAHVFGCAADLTPMHLDGYEGMSDAIAGMVRWLIAHPELGWDQAIDEKALGPGWLHVALPKPGREPRLQALTYRRDRHPEYQAFK